MTLLLSILPAVCLLTDCKNIYYYSCFSINVCTSWCWPLADLDTESPHWYLSTDSSALSGSTPQRRCCNVMYTSPIVTDSYTPPSWQTWRITKNIHFLCHPPTAPTITPRRQNTRHKINYRMSRLRVYVCVRARYCTVTGQTENNDK